MSNKYIEKHRFINKYVENNAKRIPVCILVDISGSMSEKDGGHLSRIERVNNAVNKFYSESRSNRKTKRALDILTIAVGRAIKNPHDKFESVEVNPKKLKYYHEGCNYNLGLRYALDKLDEIKDEYKANSIDYYQPWLILMTDGGVSFGKRESINVNFGSRADLAEIQKEIRLEEAQQKLTVFPVFLQPEDQLSGETFNRRRKKMENFTNDKNRVIQLNVNDEMSFEHLFEFLHRSASSVANNQGFLNTKNISSDKKSVNSNRIVPRVIYKEESANESKLSSESNLRILEELKQQQLAQKKTIEKVRRELKSKSTLKKEDDSYIKRERDVYDVLVNGNKAFPIKTFNHDDLVLTIQLLKNDDVVIKKNNGNVIFKQKITLEGKYDFIVDGDLVKINTTVIDPFEYNKIINVDSLNKEIIKTINSITDWDKI